MHVRPCAMTDARRPSKPRKSRSVARDDIDLLSTEHWSLLSTRALGWNEMAGRTRMYLTGAVGDRGGPRSGGSGHRFRAAVRVVNTVIAAVIAGIGAQLLNLGTALPALISVAAFAGAFVAQWRYQIRVLAGGTGLAPEFAHPDESQSQPSDQPHPQRS